MAKATGRALGELIAKSKAYGCMPFTCFSKLFQSIALPVINSGSSIWGHKQYTCINAIHNRACRYYLGVGKYIANAALQADTGLAPPGIDQWLSIIRQWCGIVNMNSSRINMKVLKWSY